jgi:hypothetical protein
MIWLTKRFACAQPNAKPRFSGGEDALRRTYRPEAGANDKSPMTNNRTMRLISHLEFVICHQDELEASNTFVPL